MRAQTTVVAFPAGAVTGEARVVAVHPEDGTTVVVLDRTPFHPVDHTWPDQPGDRGALEGGGFRVDVVEAVMAAQDDDGAFAVAADIPVKRGTEGWTWLVGHRIVGGAPAGLVPGVTVRASVDEALRSGLSRGHTACHLASLALDAAVADLWRKEPGVDALGFPDFEGRANQTSRIRQDGAVDEYRLGKSLRKAGFDTEGLAASLAEREERINAHLAGWISSAAASSIETEGPTIADRRRWVCALPEGTASILCGGTHTASLADFASIRVRLDLSDPQLLVMTTSAVPAP